MRFKNWNVSRVCNAGSLKTVISCKNIMLDGTRIAFYEHVIIYRSSRSQLTGTDKVLIGTVN
jgi:hypothetical protein